MSTMRNRLAHLGAMMATAFVLAAAWLNWADRLAAQQAGNKQPEKAAISPKIIVPPAADVALMKALDSKLKLSVKLLPMKEVLEMLEDKTNGDLTIVIDSQGFKDCLTDEPVFLNDPVTKDFKQPMKIRTILKMILGERPPGFGYYIEDGVLYITPATKANKKLVVRNYPVSNLIGGNQLVKTAVYELQTARVNAKGEIPFGPFSQLLNQNIEGLMNLIKGNVEPEHWKNRDGSGGPGTMSFVPTTASLQINCSLEVHYLLMASGLLDNPPDDVEPQSQKQLQAVTVKVYSIAALLDPRNLDRSQAELHKALNLVGVKSDKGGKASAATSISILSHADLLVARQPLEIHQRIEQLLFEMRGLSSWQGDAKDRRNGGMSNDAVPLPALGQSRGSNRLSANLSGVTFGNGSGGGLFGDPHSGPGIAAHGKSLGPQDVWPGLIPKK